MVLEYQVQCMKKIFTLAMAALSLCGCLSSGVRPRQYLLDARAVTPAQPLPLVTMGRSAFPSGDIRLPRYLDSSTPMMRVGKSQTREVDESVRWASPLPDMMREVLAINLASLAAKNAEPTACVDQIWFSRFAPEGNKVLRVEGIARLSLTKGGNSNLDFHFEQAWDGKTIESLIAAYNQALEHLALLLAQSASTTSASR